MTDGANQGEGALEIQDTEPVGEGRLPEPVPATIACPRHGCQGRAQVMGIMELSIRDMVVKVGCDKCDWRYNLRLQLQFFMSIIAASEQEIKNKK